MIKQRANIKVPADLARSQLIVNGSIRTTGHYIELIKGDNYDTVKVSVYGKDGALHLKSLHTFGHKSGSVYEVINP